MSPDLKPGLRFEWQTTVPEQAVVPQLFGQHVAFANDMPAVLATGYMVGLKFFSSGRDATGHDADHTRRGDSGGGASRALQGGGLGRSGQDQRGRA